MIEHTVLGLFVGGLLFQSELAEANGRYQSASKEWEKGELELQEKVVVLESERGELSERMSLLDCQLDESKTTFEEERRNTKEQMEKVLHCLA